MYYKIDNSASVANLFGECFNAAADPSAPTRGNCKWIYIFFLHYNEQSQAPFMYKVRSKLI